MVKIVIIRPRLNDFYNLPFTQEEVDFAIPFLDEDIPLYLDPFLLWKSPSLQDNALHTAITQSFNNLGTMFKNNKEKDAKDILVNISECNEVGLGSSKSKNGLKIGEKVAENILSLFVNIPDVKENGLKHMEEIQLLIDNISKDRISDFSCNLIKSFLIDYTIEQSEKYNIPLQKTSIKNVYDYKHNQFKDEEVYLPQNPQTKQGIILTPKRWLRYIPWINYDDYFKNYFIKDADEDLKKQGRVSILNYNRNNYDMVQNYIQQKERAFEDCKTDPLFKPIPVISAKRKFATISKLPTGKTDNADRKYEDNMCQLMSSLLYPNLDFAQEQSRTDSNVLIRDLIFYNNRSYDFLKDIYDDYESRQIVMELKNVQKVEREHINQLNRYLNQQFGRFGIIVTRNNLPKAILKNTIDLWAGQRKCIIALTDQDIELMVNIFESKQRSPIEVIKKKYIEFMRMCPS